MGCLGMSEVQEKPAADRRLRFIRKKGEPMVKKRNVLAAVLLFVSLGCVACVPQGEEATIENETEWDGGDLGPDATLEERIEKIQSDYEVFKPEIRTLDNGVRVQLTPGVASDQFGLNHINGAPVEYNNQFLDADNRGCTSCHKNGLADLVDRQMDYPHVKITNGLNAEVTVLQCLHCHSEDGYSLPFDSFGTLIHGIHSRPTFKGDCYSCHDMTDKSGPVLWEVAKYDILRGYTWIENPQGDFSFEQDTLTSLPQINWMENTLQDDEVASLLKASNGELPDSEALIDSWTIDVTGDVEKPATFSLRDLIDNGPSETFVTGSQCVINPEGGQLIANMEITGIPLSYLMDQCGIKDGVTALYPTAPSGYTQAIPVDDVANGNIYLVYKLNGEYLSYDEGAPVLVWDTNLRCLGVNTRFVTEVVAVSDPVEELHFYNGMPDREGNYFDKPNAGFTNLYEGQIVPANQPYSFTGYAQGFDEHVVAIEFSLDKGQTWTRFDTSSSDPMKVVWWTFTYTPEPGSYVLSVRAETDTGKVSPYPVKMMFNAE